jgi:hypothetical protein
MATKTRSAHQKSLYQAYKAQNRWEVNKRKKIARHLKKYPNDKCAENALKRGFTYSRRDPKSQIWSHTDKATAKLFTEFGRSGQEVLLMKKERAQKARKAADE